MPIEIGNLSNLARLKIGKNELTILPKEIGKLNKLLQLDLTGNQLGTIPPEIGNLYKLEVLTLGNNQLSSLPPEITGLSNWYVIDLRYNRLQITNPDTFSFISRVYSFNSYEPHYETQTITPTELSITTTDSNTIYLNWLPIEYTDHGGYYEISHATTENGPYVVRGTTNNKFSNCFEMTGLSTDSDHYFRIRTYTPAQGSLHERWSNYSEVITTQFGQGETDSELVTATNIDCTLENDIPESERDVLVAIYNENGGSNWGEGHGWLGENTPCDWLGVTCRNGHITKLTLPSRIGLMVPEIVLLDVESNDEVPIPDEESVVLSNKLTSSIENLPYLTELNLAGKSLTLPPEIGNLSRLTKLNLANSRLSELPPEMGNLSNLTELNLSRGGWSELPAVIGDISNLRILDLSGNPLTTLPAEIGNLSNLYNLYLSRTALQTLPAEIGNMSKLTYLDLVSAELSSLPPEIGQLSSLASLKLDDNRIDALPPEIGNLSNLTLLRLYRNQLTTLPAEIGNLSNLGQMNIERNQLTSLPPEIGNLSKLYILELRYNWLRRLPSEIGQLTALKNLRLRNNQLMKLPVEMENLLNLEILSLDDNCLEPDEVRAIFVNRNDLLGNYWHEAQTSRPDNLTARVKSDNTVLLKWMSTGYYDFDGGHEISYATTSSGPFTVAGNARDTSKHRYEVAGLELGKTYYFRVRTFNISDRIGRVWSSYTEVVSAALPEPATSEVDSKGSPELVTWKAFLPIIQR